MAVAIQVLSGARLGDRWEFDRPEFHAGDTPSCEVFFDPLRDPPARGRLLLFQLGDEGWTVRNLGSPGVIVNEHLVAGQARLRSGDVVRLSSVGPDLSFRLIAHLSAHAAPSALLPASPTTLPSAARNPAAWPAPTVAAAAPIYMPPSKHTPVALAVQPTSASTASVAAGTAPSGVDRFTATGRASLLIAGLALGIAALVFVRQFPGDRRPDSEPPPEVNRSPAGSRNGPTRTTSSRFHDDGALEPATAETEDDRTVAESAPAPSAGVRDLEQAIQALWLVAVEEPKTGTAWPIAVAAAVRPRVALTSATVVEELKRFKGQKWNIWLIRPGDGKRSAISDARLHVGFASAAGDAATQIYDDFGLLFTDDNLDSLVAIADDAERIDVEQGMPLACPTIAFEWEPITKYQSYGPVLTKGKVFAVTQLDPQQRGSPRLIHAALELPSKAYGSPVLTSAGHLIGVYAESVPQAADQAAIGPALQYVPIFDGRWLDGDLAASWPEATLDQTNNERSEP